MRSIQLCKYREALIILIAPRSILTSGRGKDKLHLHIILNINHFIKDVLPYWIWENSEEDTTTLWERMIGN